MHITARTWNEYIARLSKLNEKAGQQMAEYVAAHGTEDGPALIAYAHALVTKYGEGSAELACQMYDALAEASKANLPAAEPAATAEYGEVARMVNATKRQNPANLPNGVRRLVKRAGADTTLHNAIRDGAEWAWVPHGDTCPFCMMLASNGWQKASAKLLKGGHASHIHANCDCEFAVRFDGSTSVANYDPEKYLRQYRAAGSDVNAMRRIDYAARKDAINAQKRAAYAARKALPQIPNFNPLPESKVVAVLRKEAQPWIESLSDAERIAFEKYTFNPGDKKPNRFYERLNRMLRGDAEEDSVLRGYAEKISGALKRSTLKHDVICYRTVTENPFPHNVAGDIVEPEQFFSTSVVKAGALKKGNYNIIIYAKAGTFAGYVEGLSEFKKQRELLLDKDSLYRVLSTKGNQILLEVI